MERFYVYWGDVYLGWIDTEAHAEGVIRQHRNRRRGMGERTSRREYRIETAR